MQLKRRESVAQAAGALSLATRGLGASTAMSVAAGGDCIFTRRIRQIDDPDFLALAHVFQSADVGFGNCEMSFHDLDSGYPAATGACGDLNLVADPQIVRWASPSKRRATRSTLFFPRTTDSRCRTLRDIRNVSCAANID
jgi:hypothetical protein